MAYKNYDIGYLDGQYKSIEGRKNSGSGEI